MKKIIERGILLNLTRKRKFKYDIMAHVFKKYTLNIYKIGYRDGFNFRNSQGCNTAVQKHYISRKIKKVN